MVSDAPDATAHNDPLSRFVRLFLDSNLSIILVVFSLVVGGVALWVTPREEDPQIVVPLADVYVNFPGRSAAEVEQLVSSPLERLLYQIDGVEYVYSMSRDDRAIITVRFFVGQDRERSLVKLFKKIDENLDAVPPGVTGWLVKPVEIDDVPVVTMALRGGNGDGHALRRMGEELLQRLASLPNVSRAYLVGGEPRVARVELVPDRLQAYGLSPREVQRSLAAANTTLPAGAFARQDGAVAVRAGLVVGQAEELGELVVGAYDERPVFLKDVAAIRDGPAEIATYVRHGWGPARHEAEHAGSPATELAALPLGQLAVNRSADESGVPAQPCVTLCIAKQKGSNAVRVASAVLDAAATFRRQFLPDDVQLIVTRNYGLTANEKVNELVEALAVAIVIVIALLALSLGWREAVIVAVAVPVVFGLTLLVNLLFGFTINRVTLFALILSLGLLVDDPIVDVENISRHFEERGRADRRTVLDAVAEIRPPLISATLAVIVSFLPMFFITGMMGPYMSPMALNVPVAMLMSMLVAFTITPWLTYHVLKRRFGGGEAAAEHATALATPASDVKPAHGHDLYDVAAVQKTLLYRLFKPLMTPLLASRAHAAVFLAIIFALTVAAAGMGALRWVPLKMLPFDNKNELLLVLDLEEGATLERTNAVVLDFERAISSVPEITDFTSYVGTASPIDFNGLVRHYYLRQGAHQAEIRLNLVGKKQRRLQSHALGLRQRDAWTALAKAHNATLKIVELPPGPPVLASLVAEIYGQPNSHYDELLQAGRAVAQRFRQEPGIVDVDDVLEAPADKLTFVADQEKSALVGVTVEEMAGALRLALEGDAEQTLRVEGERQPLRIVLRLPEPERSSAELLGQIQVKGRSGRLVPLSELGRWEKGRVEQTIYHKNLERVVYVFAECAGRTPAECVVDVLADQTTEGSPSTPDSDSQIMARPVRGRTFFNNGGDIAWQLPHGTRVTLAGEGEWKITLDVFRDLGLAFGAAMLMIYIILVAQTGSFVVPLVVMLAIPLTVLGVMPGFFLLNAVSAQQVGGYDDPVYFTATAMIGMIALAGIVTRDAIILVDFIGLAVARGRSLFDAILESRVVRLRPILLTAGAAMLSSLPITLDPIFSGLGWSLVFGLFASTLFTLFVIPASYWLLYRDGNQNRRG